MRAREFVVREVASLADMIGNKATAPAGTPPPKNINAMVAPVGTQGTQGTVSASAASAVQTPGGGTQTPTNGIAKIPPSSAAPIPPAGAPVAGAATPKYQVGQQINLPGVGIVTVGNTTTQGTEIDATKTSIGSKIIIPAR